MALIRRTVAAGAGIVLAAVAASPALARWSASGRGSGTVPTVANVLTLDLTATGSGHAVKASGKAGSVSPYATSVTVVLCKVNSFPCSNANGVTSLTAGVTGGSYSVTSGNLNGWTTVYGQASQSQGPVWRDTANAPAPVGNP